jgi:L-alanine-DL-glutamate epimerase-like enolase superfamily enzyme
MSAAVAGALLSPDLTASEPAIGPAKPVRITDVKVIRVRERGGKGGGRPFLQITTDVGLSGVSGELFLDTPKRLEEMSGRLRELLIGQDPRQRELHSTGFWNGLHPGRSLEAYAAGRDPLTGEAIWNTRRKARHTATGTILMGLSAVDNALWDLRGKLNGVPVFRLLGGSRERLPAYLSLTPSDSLDETRRRARQFFDQGFTSQKWFLLHGPPHGKDGFRANVGVAETVRAELGREARLMFDFAVGGRGKCDWDVPYAVALAKAIQPFSPYWLEEPFSPEEIDSYSRLRGETSIPLATGEHTYTRWNIRPFLDQKLVSFVQSDPEWCGGISEWLQIADLVRQYEGVCLVPHGHNALAAAHVVASQPARLCPMVEYGVWFTRDRQTLQTRTVIPKEGQLEVPMEPGLGPELDWKRIEST